MNILSSLKPEIQTFGRSRFAQQKVVLFSGANLCVFNGFIKHKINHGNGSLFRLSAKENNLFCLTQHTQHRRVNGCVNGFFSLILKKKMSITAHPISSKTTGLYVNNSKNFKTCRGFSLTDKFIKLLTVDGKKSKASVLFFIALKICHDKLVTGKHLKDITETPTKILYQAVQNIKPSVEVRKVRIAASTYIVPAITPKERQETLAIRWIVLSAQKRKKNTKNTFSECLAQELVDSFLKQGQSRQKRDQLHNTASLNRAFVRFKWW